MLCILEQGSRSRVDNNPPPPLPSPSPLPQLKIGMQFLDALHARFVCLNNFVCFSLGQVLLPLNATRIAYFVLALALALTLTCCCCAAYGHRYLWLCQHLFFNFNFIFIFIAPVRRSRTGVDNELPSSDPIQSPDL